jgi:hypothetical protein
MDGEDTIRIYMRVWRELAFTQSVKREETVRAREWVSASVGGGGAVGST